MDPHGFVSNRLTAALISKEGVVDWLPLPRFDSQALFSKLLDENEGGELSISGATPSKQYYEVPNVLVTELLVNGSKVIVKDLLPLGEHSFLRLVDSTEELTVKIRPTFYYGMTRPIVKDDGVNTNFLNPRGRDCLTVVVKGEKVDQFTWKLQGRRWIYVNYSRNPKHSILSKSRLDFDPKNAFEYTYDYWRRETASVIEEIRTSYFVLRGLMFSPTGGVVAAPTTSLPEVDGGTRNWDYRFVWIRDSSVVVEGLVDAGDNFSARRVLTFLMSLMNVSSKPFLHPLYTVDGSDPPPERELLWLPGYRNSSPVRIGNAASEQVQLDVEGFLVAAIKKYVESSNDLDFLREEWPKLRYLADWVSTHWNLRDAGIWEERGTPKHYTHSKGMMFIALKGVGEMAHLIGEEDRWRRVREELGSWIMENCLVNGYMVRYPSTKDSDAALLSLPLYGFMEVKDPTFLATLRKLEELRLGPFVKRYAEDFMGEAKHPFLLTSLWLARIYVRLGRMDEAESLVKELNSISGELGLVGEHLNVEKREFTGNFPQAFVHAQLISLLREMKR